MRGHFAALQRHPAYMRGRFAALRKPPHKCAPILQSCDNKLQVCAVKMQK